MSAAVAVLATPAAIQALLADAQEMDREGGLAQEDAATFRLAAQALERGDSSALETLLRRSDTDVYERILLHVHPDRWPDLGYGVADRRKRLLEYERRFVGEAVRRVAKR